MIFHRQGPRAFECNRRPDCEGCVSDHHEARLANALDFCNRYHTERDDSGPRGLMVAGFVVGVLIGLAVGALLVPADTEQAPSGEVLP